jgi:antitoxin component of MazEF toxin-antitoxin module
MGKDAKVDPERERRLKGLDRIFGSASWLKPHEKAHYRAKVFKSGNSLALRLPAGLELAPGMEMDLTVEDGVFFSSSRSICQRGSSISSRSAVRRPILNSSNRRIGFSKSGRSPG